MQSISKVTVTRMLSKARVGRRGGQYVLYLDRSGSELLMQYVSRRARIHLNVGGTVLGINGTLSLDKSFRPPRIAIFLPKALNPTWQRLYDREFAVVIEVEEGNEVGKEEQVGVVRP